MTKANRSAEQHHRSLPRSGGVTRRCIQCCARGPGPAALITHTVYPYPTAHTTAAQTAAHTTAHITDDGPQSSYPNKCIHTMSSSSPPLSPPLPVSSSSNTTRVHTSRPDSVTTAFPPLAVAAAKPSPATPAPSAPAPSPAPAPAPGPASPPIPLSASRLTHPASSRAPGTVPSPTSESSSAALVSRATASDALAAPYSTSSHAEDIEMDPINPTGHRRRRSSLMSPTNGVHANGRAGHSRGQSVSSQFHSNEPKISEESQSTIKDKKGVMSNLAPDDFSDEDLHDDEETGLTAKERRRRQKKKRRNTRLDQRVVEDSVTADERKEADQTVIRKLAVNGTLIGLWYLFSLCISLVSQMLAPSC